MATEETSRLAIEVRSARLEDDDELRAILREQAMEGSISVSLEREPSFFDAQRYEGIRHNCIVGEDIKSREIAGFGTRFVRNAWVKGEKVKLGYLSQLRVRPRFRASFKSMLRAYASLGESRQPDEFEYDLTTIISDNNRATRLLTRGLPGLPTYWRIGQLTVLAIPIRKHKHRPRRGLLVGSEVPIKEAQELIRTQARQYALADLPPDEKELVSEGVTPLAIRGSRGTLNAAAFLWDQSAFKQTRVQSYQGLLGTFRPVVNFFAPLLRTPRLPVAGSHLHIRYLSWCAAREGQSESLIQLIEAGRSLAQPADLLIVGLGSDDPRLRAVKSAFPHREYCSSVYLVDWNGLGEPDIGIHDRVQLETATL